MLIMLIFPAALMLVLASTSEPRLPATRGSDLANPVWLFAGILGTPALHPVFLLYLCPGFTEAAGSAVFLSTLR